MEGGRSGSNARTTSSRFTPSTTNVFELDPIVIVIAIVFGSLLTALQYYFERRDAAAATAGRDEPKEDEDEAPSKPKNKTKPAKSQQKR